MSIEARKIELNIFWTEFSQKELENIYRYYREEAGIRVAKKLVEGIFEKTLRVVTPYTSQTNQ